MKKKNILAVLSIPFFCAALFSCNKNKAEDVDDTIDSRIQLNEKDNIELINGIELDYDSAIFDDFSHGVSYDNWYIANQAWGDDNGGVIPENVFYTDEGYLVLRANGSHYTKGEVSGIGALKDGRKTGACLISKFGARPGRYVSRFIPAPRQGACTAMWTYAYLSKTNGQNENHEIDIELPGGSTTGTISFKNALFTNWVTESYKVSQDQNMEKFTGGKCVNLNDGKFHTFGFDWYTDPEVCVYHIDGKIVAINTGFVPTLEGRLWLGNWFPVGFVGQAEFETCNMIVDWFEYIPFKNQPYTPYVPGINGYASQSQYPTNSIALPEDNWISNGDFEYATTKTNYENYGWYFDHLNKKPQDGQHHDATLKLGEGYEESAGAVVEKNAYLMTEIDSVYEGYKYDLKFKYKGDTDGLLLRLSYINISEGNIGEPVFYPLNSTTWADKTIEINAPDGCAKIKLEFYNSNVENCGYLDNFTMVRK